MERPQYPTDERGLPVIPPTECYQICLNGIKDTNRHHLAFNRRMYRSSLERAYREATGMVLRMCVCRHRDLHATYEPPRPPSAAVMREVVAGQVLPPTEEMAGVEVFIRERESFVA